MVTAAAAARGAQNYVTFETDFGPERDQYWHGVDFTLNARLRQGLTLQFGTQTGRSVEDTCAIARRSTDDREHARPRIANLARSRTFATAATSIRSRRRIRGLASYTVPKVDVLVSGTRALAAAARARRHLGGAEHGDPGHHSDGCRREVSPTGNTTVDILDNDHRLFADNRRTQIDMRFAKIFRFGQRRVDIGVDLGNLLNTNYATTYENTYQFSAGNTAQGGTWNNPTAIYTPRFVRWNLTVDF